MNISSLIYLLCLEYNFLMICYHLSPNFAKMAIKWTKIKLHRSVITTWKPENQGYILTLAKSAPVLQGLHFEWPKLVDNSYLPLYVFGGNICFWAKNYLEKVLEYHFWGKGHFSRAMKGIFLKLQNYVKGQKRGFWGWPT